MKLATLRTGSGTTAVRVEDDSAVGLAAPDVGALLRTAGWERGAAEDGPRHDLTTAEFAPVVPAPGKIICVGLNYRTHLAEMGRELPPHPTLFAKYPEALVGPTDPIELAPESAQVDWEAELAVVVGQRVRRADEATAAAAIAGFAVLNDVTMRDWQYRSPQWLQGKTFEHSTPFGPYLVTPEDLPGGVAPRLALRCEVDGRTVQRADTGDLVFDPVTLVRYISQVLTLNPGDVIATGTPGGVGHARTPPAYLGDGSVLVTEIERLGRAVNTVRTPVPA